MKYYHINSKEQVLEIDQDKYSDLVIQDTFNNGLPYNYIGEGYAVISDLSYAQWDYVKMIKEYEERKRSSK